MKISRNIKKEYENLLEKHGESNFLERIFSAAKNSKGKFKNPENILLSQAEGFFSLYRETNNENHFIIGRALRRAAHKLYRENKKDCILKEATNKKFLQLVS